MGFGRKGLSPGVTAPQQPEFGKAGGATPARPRPDAASGASGMAEDEIAARREAFLSAERAAGNIGPAAIAARPGTPEAIERKLQEHRQGRTSRPGMAGPRDRKLLFGDPLKRNLIVAYVLWYFACVISTHRFYCGASESAWYQIGLFFGGFVLLAIWAPMGIAALIGWFLWIIADLFLMPGMMRRFKAEYSYDDCSEVFA